MGRFTGAGSASGAGISFPPATIILFAGVGATPPAGWLLCDGASVLRATFPALFTAIGILYGSVDGTHFNLPKFDDNRKARGAVNDAARGTTGGANSVTLTIAEMPTHTHIVNPASHSHQSNVRAPPGGASGLSGIGAVAVQTGSTSLTNNDTGGDGSHNNESLFVDVNYLIHV